MIIDTHMHLGPLRGYYNYTYSVQSILKLMDELNILYAISSHTMAIALNEYELSEEESNAAYELSGGRILSYHVYDPRVAARSLTFMERNRNRGNYIGIKIHPSSNYTDGADERYRPAWEYARAHKLPILAHTWDLSPTNPKQKYAHPTAFVKYLEEYPEVPFIMGHSGGRYNAIVQAVEIGRRFPQVHYDIAGDIYIADLIEYLVQIIGSSRIFYGSDFSMMDLRTQLGAVLGANISMADKERILYDNAMNFFQLTEHDK